jgi:hypothetical protein
VDIVLEGKIDPQEGMTEVLETVLQLKSINNAILRLSSADNVVSGRVAFSQNGYILGGRLDESGETGYPAIRKLFSIKDGNYAVLDVGRTHIPEVNQTLWIKAEYLLPVLSNLPESPDGIIEGNRDILDKEKAKTGHINLRTKEWKDAPGPATVDVQSKARKFDVGAWRSTVMLLWCLVLVAITAGVVQYWDSITPYIPLPMFHKAPPVEPGGPVVPTTSTTTSSETAPTKP